MKENKSFVPPGGPLPGAAVCSKHIYLALRGGEALPLRARGLALRGL